MVEAVSEDELAVWREYRGGLPPISYRLHRPPADDGLTVIKELRSLSGSGPRSCSASTCSLTCHRAADCERRQRLHQFDELGIAGELGDEPITTRLTYPGFVVEPLEPRDHARKLLIGDLELILKVLIPRRHVARRAAELHAVAVANDAERVRPRAALAAVGQQPVNAGIIVGPRSGYALGPPMVSFRFPFAHGL